MEDLQAPGLLLATFPIHPANRLNLHALWFLNKFHKQKENRKFLKFIFFFRQNNAGGEV